MRPPWRRQQLKADAGSAGAERAGDPLGLQQWVDYFTFGGSSYPFLLNQTLAEPIERPDGTYASYGSMAYRANGVVFACMAARMLIFSEARFQFRQLRSGRPGKLFGSQELAVLETPWPNGTTGDLLTRAIVDVDIGGNFFCLRRGNTLHRLRPDWVTVALGSKIMPNEPQAAPDSEVIGYSYWPGGIGHAEPIHYAVEEVAHWAPIPHPFFRWRGMSWLDPIIEELSADSAATRHKLKFFENGAVPGIIIGLDPQVTVEAFEQWKDKARSELDTVTGAENAYRTLILGGGAKATIVGSDFQQMDFASVQGHGETRICAAARVPPIIAGMSEGLQSAPYSVYDQARQAFADMTMRPLWRNFAGSMSKLLTIPGGSELWYDDRDIPFLREDVLKASEAFQSKAAAIKTLIDSGYNPDDVRNAVESGDLNLLGQHTGLVSVQLRPMDGAALPPGQTAPQLPPGQGASAERANGHATPELYPVTAICVGGCGYEETLGVPMGSAASHVLGQADCPRCRAARLAPKALRKLVP